MEFYQDDDWLEEEPEEVYDNEIEYLYGDDEAEASDQILLDQISLRRMVSEWEPSEAEDDAAVDEAVDPILPFIGDVRENAHDPVAPISTATLLEQLDEVTQYELALEESGTANVKVKKENKYPKRIRKNGAVNSTGTEIGVAV